MALLLAYPALVRSSLPRPMTGAISFIVLYWAHGGLLLTMVSIRARATAAATWLNGRVGKTLSFIGYFSYPIYLWHVAVTRLVAPIFAYVPHASLELQYLASFAIYVCVATAAGVLFAALVDKPSLRMRDRLFPSRTSLPIVSRDMARAVPEQVER